MELVQPLLGKLNEVYQFVTQVSKDSPVVAGVVSLWGLGIITVLFWKIPLSIWFFLKRQCTTTVVLNNQDDIFYQLLKWLSVNKIHSFIRSFNFSANSFYGWGDSVMTYGYGANFFFYKHHLIIFYRKKVEANATVHSKEVIYLIVIGRNRHIFKDLFDQVKREHKDKDSYSVFHYHEKVWHNFCSVPKRKLSTVDIPKEDKNSLINHIDEFRKRKQWYFDNGIPYKTGVLLYGPPGTGKTSLVSAICSEYNKNCYIINLSTVSDDSLKTALAAVPRGQVVLMEDIDTYTERREPIKVDNGDKSKSSNNTSQPPVDVVAPLTLGGILNALDGIACGTDRIVFATTNFIDNLDDALKREGRFDLKIKMDYMTNETMRSYLKRLYPHISSEELNRWNVLPKLAPCKLQQLVFENKYDPMSVLSKVAVKNGLRVNTNKI